MERKNKYFFYHGDTEAQKKTKIICHREHKEKVKKME